MNTTDTEIADLEAKLKKARADKAADERAEKTALARAKRVAGDNHTKAMTKLYDLLDVEPEMAQKRTVKSAVKSFAVDRDETLRSQRLVTMVEGLLKGAGSDVSQRLRAEDEKGRKDRQEAAAKAQKEAAESSERDSKSTASTSTKEPAVNASNATSSNTFTGPVKEPATGKPAAPQSAQAKLLASMS